MVIGRGKRIILAKSNVPVSFFPSQIPHALPQDLSMASIMQVEANSSKKLILDLLISVWSLKYLF
jgi:hypothetical protein